MNVVSFNERSCEKYRRYFDAYLDNELLVETNQELLSHLNSCSDCSEVLKLRSQMKQRVRTAVAAAQAPPELVAALRERLRTERSSFFSRDAARWMMAVAAVFVMAIGSLIAVRSGVLLDSDSRQNLVARVSTGVQEILRVGLIDHVHCTILFEQWKRMLSFDEMKNRTGRSALGPEFIDLVPLVEAKLGSDFTIIQGHRCNANRRQYIHIILKGDNDVLLSLVITEKRGESFGQEEAIAVMKASEVPLYTDHEGQLQVAGFETEHYLAYVVSNLGYDDNLRIASLLAPSVSEHLRKLEL